MGYSTQKIQMTWVIFRQLFAYLLNKNTRLECLFLNIKEKKEAVSCFPFVCLFLGCCFFLIIFLIIYF